jgi:hypothetical protein
VRGRVGLFARYFPSFLERLFYEARSLQTSKNSRNTPNEVYPRMFTTEPLRHERLPLDTSRSLLLKPSWKLNGKSSHPASNRSPICSTPQLDARSFEGSPLCGAEDHNDSPEQRRPQGTHLLSELQGCVYSTVAHYAGTADSIFSDSPPT